MSSNSALMQKAEFTLGNLSGGTKGGLLNPEQSDMFIRKLILAPSMLNSGIRRVPMNTPQQNINKIQFASRILRAGALSSASGMAARESRRSTTSQRSSPTTEQIQLNSKLVIAEVNLPYDVIEDNIERGSIGAMTDVGGVPTTGGLVDTIMALIAGRTMTDLEELAILGDTTSSDTFLAQTDGWLKRATTNVSDAGSTPVSLDVFTDGALAMPVQYLRNRSQNVHFVSTHQEINYRNTLAQRETPMGDAQHQGLAPTFAAGMQVYPVEMMPDSQGLLCNRQNLLWGIQRDILIETDKDIAGQAWIVVVSARVDFQVEEELAVVRYSNLG